MAGNKEPELWPDGRRELYLEKPLPSSEESERVILGAILLDNQVMVDAAEQLLSEYFYNPLNRRVFAAMLKLWEKPNPQLDPITIGEELKKEGSLDSIGGITTITNLTFGLPHFSNVEEYIKVIKDKALIRTLVRACNSITTEALAEEDDAETILNNAEQQIFSLSEQVGETQFVPASVIAHDRVHQVHQRAQTGNPVTGLSTGYADLDEITLGLQRTDLIIIAGRPSMGKTAFGLTLAQNAAFRGDKSFAVVFSLEMNKEQLVDRMLCSEAAVNSHKFRAGLITDAEFARVHAAHELILEGGPIEIDDTPGISVSYARKKLRRLSKQHNRKVDLVIFDYLQLMGGNVGSSSKRYESRQQEVSQISRELKSLAKELDAPVVALSQLSRAPEARAANNHRPLLSDLRESGSIEQDADVVGFVYREEEYPHADGTVVGHGEIEIIIGKQRNGPTGTKKLYFNKETGAFANYASTF